MAFLIFGIVLTAHFKEAGLLLNGVIELRKGVAQFHTAHKALKAFHGGGVAGFVLGQRGNIARVIVQEGRLDESRLQIFAQQVIDKLAAGHIGVELHAFFKHHLGQALRIGVGVDVNAGGFDEPFAQNDALPGGIEVDLVAVKSDLAGAEGLIANVGDHVLGQFHDLQVICVGPVELKLGKLRVMFIRNAFIAEVAADLVDAVKAAHYQAFEVQLKGDAQVEVLLQLVVMGHERLGGSAPVNRLQNGGLYFQETTLVEVVSQRIGDGCPGAEDLAHFLVDGQISVPLTVAGLRVGQAGMTHHLPIHYFIFGSRQRGDGLGQHLKVDHQKAHLARAGAGNFTTGLDKIAQVKLSLEKIHVFFAQLIDAQKELDLASTIFNMRKS
ncbi:hypothetical protein SDC9_93853 [bioreactor metagenome]|uniref:Uncharacterized protein n=1 Tax=bioreactor metagenome TaxID=1076179 RepID=A0A645A1T0_9ZZZZ